uniref:Uncharacterized protein n=1 Tax=Lygus hesperus TaxID=30085 RepID=A0A0K8SS16_LYGHE
MMMKGDIPIPSQIVEIIGEKNVADIYDGDSSDDSSVEVWKTNVKACSAEYYKNYSSKRTPARQRKRRVILNQLKVFQSFYVAQKGAQNTVPVNGRLTIVESVEVPQIDEFDISSPPRIPLPDNLRARNSFVGSDESTAQSISGSPRKISQGKLGRAIPKDHQVLFQTKNTIPLLKEKSQKRN